MFLKEVDFVGSVSTMIKFILIHNSPTIIITNQKPVSFYASSSNFIPILKDFIDVNRVNMIMFSGIKNVQILTSRYCFLFLFFYFIDLFIYFCFLEGVRSRSCTPVITPLPMILVQ